MSEPSYQVVHTNARKVLPRECAMEDETCKGRLECALRKDAPPELVRTDERIGCRYFVGINVLDGYMRMCTSHHIRYDNPGGRTAAVNRGKASGIWRAALEPDVRDEWEAARGKAISAAKKGVSFTDEHRKALSVAQLAYNKERLDRG